MKRLGLIGGTGLDRWGSVVASHPANSVYGPPSAAPAEYQIGTTRVFFLPRHGQQHQIPPHAVNYRANIDVLKQLGVEGIVAVNAVGGISSHGHPGALVVPDQLLMVESYLPQFRNPGRRPRVPSHGLQRCHSRMAQAPPARWVPLPVWWL